MIISTEKFYLSSEETDFRQHLNLSREAWKVIDDDRRNFYDSIENESRSGILNTIFLNFAQEAKASISLRLNEKEEELYKFFDKSELSKISDTTKEKIIDVKLHEYLNELKQLAKSYDKGEGRKFRLNKEVIAYLQDQCAESDYYDNSLGSYIKAVLEEYATLPTYQRERIFFKEIYQKIESAIEKKKKIKIVMREITTYKDDKKFSVKFYISPYKIMCDKNYMYNYVVGKSEKIVESTTIDGDGRERQALQLEEEKITCTRLSRIIKCSDPLSTKGCAFNAEERKEMDDALYERGVMFIKSKIKDIIVKFSERGLNDFRNRIYLRPEFYEQSEDDYHIYKFRCTEEQMKNYINKFGWDAVVLSPDSLANRLKTFYDRGYKAYLGMNKEQILSSEPFKSKNS